MVLPRVSDTLPCCSCLKSSCADRLFLCTYWGTDINVKPNLRFHRSKFLVNYILVSLRSGAHDDLLHLCTWCTDNSKQLQVSSEFSPPADAPEANENDLVQSMLMRSLPKAPPQSVHVDEASKQVRKFVKRWQSIKSLESYSRLCLSLTSYLYSGVATAERLAILVIFYAVATLIDDFLFDRPDEASLANEYGISSSIRESPQKIGEFLEKLNTIIRQENPPVNPTPIERMWWESGRDLDAWHRRNGVTRSLINSWLITKCVLPVSSTVQMTEFSFKTWTRTRKCAWITAGLHGRIYYWSFPMRRIYHKRCANKLRW